MASPIGHAMVGLTVAAVTAQVTGAPFTPSLWAGAVIAAGLPDLDLALGLVGLRGPRFHRRGSHSLILIALGVVVGWGLTAAWPGGPDGRVLAAWSAALVSHPLLDVWTTGPAAAANGWGISLLWPVSRRRWFVQRPLFDTGEALSRCRSLRCVWQGVRPEIVRLGVVCGPIALLTMLVW